MLAARSRARKLVETFSHLLPVFMKAENNRLLRGHNVGWLIVRDTHSVAMTADGNLLKRPSPIGRG
jgi:hypothetical protein